MQYDAVSCNFIPGGSPHIELSHNLDKSNPGDIPVSGHLKAIYLHKECVGFTHVSNMEIVTGTDVYAAEIEI